MRQKTESAHAALARLPDEWAAAMRALGQPAYRGGQVFRWIHARGVTDPDGMTDLPKALRAALEAELGAAASVAEVRPSADGTKKLVVAMGDGARVETVLLPAAQAASDADAAAVDDDSEDAPVGQERVTQCISTQVGCAMGCVFCASGVAGLKRHLGAAEIVSQVLLGRAHLPPGAAIRNVVFMGMGEPLHNYEATVRTIQILSHPDGMGISPRRMTVSTSGLVPEINRLGREFEGRVGLAISLHQADDEKRSALMPINLKYPLRELMGALSRYPRRWGRRVTIEYTLVADQNDGISDARRLARLLDGRPVKVNLIPMNPIQHSALGPPPLERVSAFQRVLTDAGLSCFVRRRRGDDVAAACGQLALAGEGPNASFLRRQPS